MTTMQSEHRRLAPVLAKAREYDVVKPDPQAIFEAGSGGFQIWCTPENNPGGDWKRVKMLAGAYAKPAEYVASVHWRWEGERIVGLNLSTAAYLLADQLSDEYNSSERRRDLGERKTIFNRATDLAWAKKQIRWLFKQAGVTCPPIFIDSD